jgi:hypothetical protein
MLNKIQDRIDDLLTSIQLAKSSSKSTSHLQKKLGEYKELLIYVSTNPSREFIESMLNKLKLNVLKCEEKISIESQRYTYNNIPKKEVELIKSEFDYANCIRRIEYLNFLLQD